MQRAADEGPLSDVFTQGLHRFFLQKSSIVNHRIVSSLPVLIIALVIASALFNLFASPLLSGCAIIACVVFMLIWRRLVLTRVIGADYTTRFDAASPSVMMRAAKWSMIISVGVYAAVLLAMVLAFTLGDSWTTSGLLVLIIVMLARTPWTVIATNWELHRVEPAANGT